MKTRWLLIFGFLTMITLPAICVRPDAKPLSSEKRQLAPLPSFRIADLEKFPSTFEPWFRDHLGFRDLLIGEHSRLKVKVFHQSSVPNVLLGSDGWLFYAGFNDGADITDFQGKMPLTKAQLQARLLEIQERAASLERHGIAYMFVLIPNKHTVYPELLPARFGQRQRGNRLDQFVEHMRAHATFPWMDVTAAMANARTRGPLYYKTDTHWNEVGARLTYEEVLRAAGKFKAGLPEPLLESQFNRVESKRAGGDLAEMLSMRDGFSEPTYSLSPKPSAPKPAPLTAVVIGDSFSYGLAQFLQASFVRVVRMDGRFALDQILATKPDLVIDERVERYLMLW